MSNYVHNHKNNNKTAIHDLPTCKLYEWIIKLNNETQFISIKNKT